jgi:protein-disulfide isomerase
MRRSRQVGPNGANMHKPDHHSGAVPNRRSVLAILGAGAAALGIKAAPAYAQGGGEPSEAAVLRDPEVPVGGNADGDIAIVEWFDYQCPYCRKLEPELRQVVHDDGKVRLVWKDWPILGPVSVVAARLALAAKYQGKYAEAHDAMLALNSRLTEPKINEALAGAGIDVDRARRDLATNDKAITAILARNNEQAEGLAFRGTPSFIVGKFRVPGALTTDEFTQVIADARKAKAAK